MKNKKKIILDLCGGTGSWAKPYKDEAYRVRTITLPEYDILKTVIGKDDITFMGKDKTTGEKSLIVMKSAIYGILAAPPLHHVFFCPH